MTGPIIETMQIWGNRHQTAATRQAETLSRPRERQIMRGGIKSI